MWILFTGLLSAGFTRLQIRLNPWLRLTAVPRADRWHQKPTPESGGLAIFLSCALAYGLACPGKYPWIALAVAGMWIFGLVDDRRRFGPWSKIVVPLAAAVFVVSTGTVCPLTGSYALDWTLSVLFIVMITHAFNLIDNMDGLCAGVVVTICLFRWFLLTSQGYRADAGLWAILAAAFTGFLLSNFHPARIFMGDCGSLPVGFALAALTLADPVPHRGAVLRFCYPAITFAYPIFDIALVSTLRVLTGRPIWVGGRDHSSHRLASLGLDQKLVVWILWLLTALSSSLGIMVYCMPDTLLAASALLMGLFGMLALSLATLPGYPRPQFIRLNRRAIAVGASS